MQVIVSQPLWRVVWCNERCHKHDCRVQRWSFGKSAEAAGASLFCLRKAMHFSMWLSEHSRSCPDYVLLTDWREVKPCIVALNKRDSTDQPHCIIVLCDTAKQLSKASTWAKCHAKDSALDVYVRKSVELTPSSFAALAKQIPAAVNVPVGNALALETADELSKKSHEPMLTQSAGCEHLQSGVRSNDFELKLNFAAQSCGWKYASKMPLQFACQMTSSDTAQVQHSAAPTLLEESHLTRKNDSFVVNQSPGTQLNPTALCACELWSRGRLEATLSSSEPMSMQALRPLSLTEQWLHRWSDCKVARDTDWASEVCEVKTAIPTQIAHGLMPCKPKGRAAAQIHDHLPPHMTNILFANMVPTSERISLKLIERMLEEAKPDHYED